MNDTGSALEYKGYVGGVKIDWHAGVLVGRVTNVTDVITFQGRTVEEVRQRFEKAVDTYLDWCRETGTEPQSPS